MRRVLSRSAVREAVVAVADAARVRAAVAVEGGAANFGGELRPPLEERELLAARILRFAGVGMEAGALREQSEALPDVADLRLVVLHVLVGVRGVPLRGEARVL